MVANNLRIFIHNQRLSRRHIQEGTIMRNNKKTSFPLIREIFFEPQKSINIDKIRWLIKEEKFWFREKNLGKCNFGALSS